MELLKALVVLTAQSSVKLFADNALLYVVVANDRIETVATESRAMAKKQFNPLKCKPLCISKKRFPPKEEYFLDAEFN